MIALMYHFILEEILTFDVFHVMLVFLFILYVWYSLNGFEHCKLIFWILNFSYSCRCSYGLFWDEANWKVWSFQVLLLGISVAEFTVSLLFL